MRAHRRRGVTTAALLAAVVAMGLGVASTRVGARPTLDAANGRPPAAPPPSGANPGPAPGAADLATPSAGATGGDPAPIGGSTATPASETTATPGSPPEPPPTTAPPARSGATADLTCPSSRTPEAPAVPAPPCTTSVPAPASGVVIAGTRYAIGEPGDEILVGDWRCDGTLGVAVVRPVWGDVYLFERLPDGDEERTAVQVAHLGSGARLETGAAVPDGCPALVGRFADGSTAVVTVPDALPAPRPRPGAAP